MTTIVAAALFRSPPRSTPLQHDDGRTALMFAAQNGHVEVAQFLTEKGANLEAKVTHAVPLVQ